MQSQHRNTAELPIPAHYQSDQAARFHYRPDEQALLAAAEAWRTQHGLLPAAADRRRVHLLLIDLQKDFCFPEGSLYVGGRSGRGALEDSDRVARFIYRNLGRISDLTCTLDTHFPFQVFFPAFWLDEQGQHPAPHTEVKLETLRAGRLRPNPAMASWLCNGNYAWLQRQVEFYCEQLEAAGKYTLYLWPPHCLLGSEGHALAGVVQAARLFHSFARGSRAAMEVKGGHALTENYSVLAPEVLLRHDGKPLAQRNTHFLETLLDADAVIIGGQAASHCVKSTIDDLLGQILAQDPALARKVYLLEDCMSSVAVPDGQGGFYADFTPQAEQALQRYAAAGMHCVRSTEPMDTWPGLDALLQA